MAQGAENDLKNITFFTNTSTVDFVEDNAPIDDLNFNILAVDNKAIAGSVNANTSQASLATHIGGSGLSAHPAVTDTVASFMSAADKVKLDGIQYEAQINILSATDALELVGGGLTRLHEHITATTTNDGMIASADKTKLDGIQAGAQVNNLTLTQAAALTNGNPDANAYHTHVTVPFTEVFTAGLHSNTDHFGLEGVVSVFPGFAKQSFRNGPEQIGPGATHFSFPYTPFMTTLECVMGGLSYISDQGGGASWGNQEAFVVTGVERLNTPGNLWGTIHYEVKPGYGAGDMKMRCWQGGYGIA